MVAVLLDHFVAASREEKLKAADEEEQRVARAPDPFCIFTSQLLTLRDG